MTNLEVKRPIPETGGPEKMGKQKERVLTDAEVEMLNKMVGAGLRILRNKEISVSDPRFQDTKKEAVEILFGIWEIFSPDDRERLWPIMAARLESGIKQTPQEYFAKKRLRELKASLGSPEDKDMREKLEKAKKEIVAAGKRKKYTAAMIRDAVYKVLSQYKHASKRDKETEANELKYYLCVEHGILMSDPDLKSVADASRQKDLF